MKTYGGRGCEGMATFTVSASEVWYWLQNRTDEFWDKWETKEQLKEATRWTQYPYQSVDLHRLVLEMQNDGDAEKNAHRVIGKVLDGDWNRPSAYGAMYFLLHDREPEFWDRWEDEC